MKNSNKKLEKIFSDIKSVKIQGATNIAKAAVEAYSIFPTKQTAEKLISLRPTEPMLQNVVKQMQKGISKNQILSHFSESQEEINKNVLSLINNNFIVFTHCHSKTITNSLVYAKSNKKHFQVYNTETRPLYQGRKTAIELSKAGIKVVDFVDSAAALAIRRSDIILIGADAILKNGDVINKIGSGMFSQIAKDEKVPVYVVSDSWKFSKKPIKIEKRNPKEVWKENYKKIIPENPAFEKIPSKNIKAIISELGILTPSQFVKKAGKKIYF